jgi:molybdopterin-guanine dinucleotide biosynthesis protein A
MVLAPAEANLAVIKGKPLLNRVVERLVVVVAVAVVVVG